MSLDPDGRYSELSAIAGVAFALDNARFTGLASKVLNIAGVLVPVAEAPGLGISKLLLAPAKWLIIQVPQLVAVACPR